MSILVATGGAAHSTVALTFGAHLAEVTKSAIVLLTVVKREEERARAQGVLESARFVIEPIGLPISERVRIGHPAEEILAELEDAHYSIVVVGEKQHHGLLTRFVLGSTAERVVEHSPCPVVVVKGQIGAVQRILLCDSGQPQHLSDKVAKQLPALFAGVQSVTVLHVMSQMVAGPGVDGHQLRADAAELIAERSEEGALLMHDLSVMGRTGIPTEPKVRHGRVVDEILAEASEGNYDLVVVGAHQGTGWRRILLDDITHQVLVGLDRPVLVVR